MSSSSPTNQDCLLFQQILESIKQDTAQKQKQANNQKEDLMKIIVKNKRKYQRLEHDYDRALNLARDRINKRDQKISEVQEENDNCRSEVYGYETSILHEKSLNENLTRIIRKKDDIIERYVVKVDHLTDNYSKLAKELSKFKNNQTILLNENRNLKIN